MEADVPHMVTSLQSSHIRLMNAMLQALERTGVLHVVRKPSDHAAASIGAKIFFADASQYSVLSGLEGHARGAFLVSALRDADREVQASSDETKADYLPITRHCWKWLAPRRSARMPTL